MNNIILAPQRFGGHSRHNPAASAIPCSRCHAICDVSPGLMEKLNASVVCEYCAASSEDDEALAELAKSIIKQLDGEKIRQ